MSNSDDTYGNLDSIYIEIYMIFETSDSTEI